MNSIRTSKQGFCTRVNYLAVVSGSTGGGGGGSSRGRSSSRGSGSSRGRSSFVITAASVCAAEGGGVSLGTLLDGGLCGRVEEEVGVVSGVLGLNKAVELRVLGGLLAEHGVAVRGRVGREVRWRVLLDLAVLDREGDHVLLGRVIKLLGSICTCARACQTMRMQEGSA